jgi:uncharacterized protein YyaL (SSP411 family)
MMAACLDAYEVALRRDCLDRARALADTMIARLRSPQGAFYDAPAPDEALGRLSMRQTPPKENAIAAMGLLRLARLTHKASYEDAARAALAPFAGIVEAQGYFAADYARAVDMLLNPGAEVKIVATDGDAAALHAGALTLPLPDRTVRVIDPGDAEALAEEGLPAHPAPAAYACFGTLCSAPVTTPDDLIEIVERTRQAYESTRMKEPLLVPRSERESD